jgi:hypothetical protein
VLPPAMRDQSEHNLDQAMTTWYDMTAE